MKTLAALALVSISLASIMSTAQAADAPANIPVIQYTYGTKLDIAKVVNITSVPPVCTVVPVTMSYLDHQGQEHRVQYEVMGSGCDQG